MTTKARILKDIRSYCLTICCNGDEEYLRECPQGGKDLPCVLFVYRLGKDPNPIIRRKKPVSDASETLSKTHSGEVFEGVNFNDPPKTVSKYVRRTRNEI